MRAPQQPLPSTGRGEISTFKEPEPRAEASLPQGGWGGKKGGGTTLPSTYLYQMSGLCSEAPRAKPSELGPQTKPSLLFAATPSIITHSASTEELSQPTSPRDLDPTWDTQPLGLASHLSSQTSPPQKALPIENSPYPLPPPHYLLFSISLLPCLVFFLVFSNLLCLVDFPFFNVSARILVRKPD